MIPLQEKKRLFCSGISLPFIFSFSVKLPWIFLSSASMVRPPISASRWVRLTIPIPNTIRVTCCGSELTRLLLLPPDGLFGVVGSCCSFSKITLQNDSEGLWPFSTKLYIHFSSSFPQNKWGIMIYWCCVKPVRQFSGEFFSKMPVGSEMRE